MEHNHGHGKQHLSSRLASLIILALQVRTVLDWADDKLQLSVSLSGRDASATHNRQNENCC
jgi:hypothetical protein